MSNLEEILSDPEITRSMAENKLAADRITNAAKRLIEQPNNTQAENVAALKKIIPSLVEQVIHVFFSYKTKDESAVKAIVQVLRENAANRLDITFQAEFAQEIAGKSWREKIGNAVRRANWFILYLPNPSDELDWCLFETGLFHAQLTSADRLICIHHPDTTVPSPIDNYHAISGTLPEVEKFLQMVFIEKDPIFGLPPINHAIAENIPQLAQRVVNAIRIPVPRLHREVFEPCIEIHVDNARALKAKEELDSAIIVSANKKALALFDFIEPQKTFGELREGIEETHGDGRWREELFHAIVQLAKGKVISPIQAVLHSPNGKTYHPIVLAVDRVGVEGPIEKYLITFAEDVTTADTAAMPDKLAALATLLRFTFRFRWEVLEPFTRAPLSDDEITRLDVSMARITADWDSRGRIDQKAIGELFNNQQRKRVAEMSAAWSLLRNPDQTGELDIAIKNKDGRVIPTLLASVLPINQEFLEFAADRFAEMVAEEDKPRR